MNCDIAPNKPQIYSRLEIYKGLSFKGEKIGGPTSYCCLGTTARYIIAARPNQGGNPVGRSCAPEMLRIEDFWDMERLVGRSPRRRRLIRLPCILMVQPSSGSRPKDVKNAEREVQLDPF